MKKIAPSSGASGAVQAGYTHYNLMLTTTPRRHDATTPHASLVLNGSGGTAPKREKLVLDQIVSVIG